MVVATMDGDIQLTTILRRSSLLADLQVIDDCITDVKGWMTSRKLQLNDSKTELLVVGSQRQLQGVSVSDVKVAFSVIKPSSVAKDLGVYIDSYLSLDAHISHYVKSAITNSESSALYVGTSPLTVLIPL